MNKRCASLTVEQYKEIITTMRNGFSGFRPNNRIASALVLEANLGLRISDVLTLRLCDIVSDGERFRLDIVERKTGKRRTFTVPILIYQWIENYCLKNSIQCNDAIFQISERAVQKALKKVCDYLQLSGISTHSFRKFFASQVYVNNGYNIALVQHLLQHSSVSTTQRYIGIDVREVEEALSKHNTLI